MGNRYVNLAKNVGFFAISSFATRLISFVLVPLYTYCLSRNEYGLTDLMNTTIMLVSPLITISIADAVLRYMIDDASRQREYASVGFVVTLGSLIVLLALLPLLRLPMFGGLGDWAWWFYACCAINIFQSFLSNVARGCDQTRQMVIASLITSVVTMVGAFVFILWLRMGIRGYFLSTFLGGLLGSAWYLTVAQIRANMRMPQRSSWRLLRPMLVYCIPLIPNALFWWINQSVNRFFITAQLGVAATGLFAAASKIPSFLSILSTIFQQAWNLTAFQEYKAGGRRHFFSLVFRLYDILLAAGAGALILLTQPLSHLLLQKSFYSAWVFVPMLILSFYYSAVSGFLGTIYTASLKTRDLFLTTFAGAVLCMVFTYLFVGGMGIEGACLASMLSNLIVFVLRIFSSRRILDLDFRYGRLAAEFVLLLMMAIATAHFGRTGLIAAAIGFIIMLGVQLVGERADLRALRDRLRHRGERA